MLSWLKRLAVPGAVVALSFVSVPAFADSILSSVLASEKGSFTAGPDNTSVASLTATVNYAVYAPGDFSSVFSGSVSTANLGTLGSLSIPSGDYVYVYQIQNISTASGTLAADIADQFSFGVAPGVAVDGIGFVATGGVNPFDMTLATDAAGTNVVFDFSHTSGPIQPGQTSADLILVSPFAPGSAVGLVVDHGAQVQGPVPVPAPLPATASTGLAMLAGLGVLGGVSVLRRRRQMA